MAEISRTTANVTAERIRSATNQGENTPQLVGGLMRDMVASVQWNGHGLFADLPASSAVTGDQYFATDARVLFIWDGTKWAPQGGFVGYREYTASTDKVTGVLTINMDLALGACIVLDDPVELVLTWTDLPPSDPTGLMTAFRLEILVTGDGAITEWNGDWPDATPPTLAVGSWHLVTGWVSSRANVLRFQAAENYAT